jgi:hypothetical protein
VPIQIGIVSLSSCGWASFRAALAGESNLYDIRSPEVEQAVEPSALQERSVQANQEKQIRNNCAECGKETFEAPDAHAGDSKGQAEQGNGCGQKVMYN